MLKLLYPYLLYIPMEKKCLWVQMISFHCHLVFCINFILWPISDLYLFGSHCYFSTSISWTWSKKNKFQYNNILCDLVVETRRIALRDNITIELIVYQPVSLNACLSIEFWSSVLLRYDGQTDGRTDRRLEIRPAAFYDHS